MADEQLAAETAYYYPEPFWFSGQGGWIKSLLLFFDGVSILLPDYMYGRHLVADPTLATPLEQRGLLRVLTPETFLDEAMANELAEIIEGLIERGAFDLLDTPESFAELSMSRMGNAVLHDVAARMEAKLRERGLARETEDGVSIPMHPAVRGAYLHVLAQLARGAGKRQGLDLHPVTDIRWRDGVRDFLELPSMPSRGHVVAADLDVVGVDLEDIPLDDVLQFRDEASGAHRRYMANLRTFVLDLSHMDDADRARALKDREAALQEEANDLRQRALAAWKKPKKLAGFGLGITGAVISAASGGIAPALIGGAAATLGMLPDRAEGSAYAYVFDARKRLE